VTSPNPINLYQWTAAGAEQRFQLEAGWEILNEETKNEGVKREQEARGCGVGATQ
jgi:hypothetical protein